MEALSLYVAIFVQKLNDDDISLGYLDMNLFVKLTYLVILTDIDVVNKSKIFLS